MRNHPHLNGNGGARDARSRAFEPKTELQHLAKRFGNTTAVANEIHSWGMEVCRNADEKHVEFKLASEELIARRDGIAAAMAFADPVDLVDCLILVALAYRKLEYVEEESMSEDCQKEVAIGERALRSVIVRLQAMTETSAKALGLDFMWMDHYDRDAIIQDFRGRIRVMHEARKAEGRADG